MNIYREITQGKYDVSRGQDRMRHFREDLFEHYDVTNNPKAMDAYEIAWIYANEFSEIANLFGDLVKLIK